MIGFTGYIIFGLAIGLSWDHIIDIPVLFVILYGLLCEFSHLHFAFFLFTSLTNIRILFSTLNSEQLLLETLVREALVGLSVLRVFQQLLEEQLTVSLQQLERQEQL